MRVTSYPAQRPKVKSKTHYKRMLIGVLVICATYICATSFWPLQAIQASVISQPAETVPAATLAWPSYGTGAIGTVKDGVLAINGSDSPIPTASMAKIVTALVVLDAKPITSGLASPSITFSNQDVALYHTYLSQNGAVAPVSAGLQLDEYQALQAMLLPSANNYADSLAIWAYGSLDAYITAANQYLKTHGIRNTVIADASGFSPNTMSTPTDLVNIGRLAMQNPVLADITSQESADVPDVGTIHSTNILLGTDGIVGLKTGTTDEAGSCLLFAAKYAVNGEPIVIVGVLTGAPSHQILFNDVTTLLHSAQVSFHSIQAAKKGQTFAIYKTPWGTTAKAKSVKDVNFVVWGGEAIRNDIAAADLKPGAQMSGNANFKTSAQNKRVDLKLDQPLSGPSIWWRLIHPTVIF